MLDLLLRVEWLGLSMKMKDKAEDEDEDEDEDKVDGEERKGSNGK